MLGLILFIISFLLVISSSYFIAGAMKEQKTGNFAIIWALIFVSQIIVSIEMLSLIKQINQTGILIINTVIFIVSLLYWKYKNKPQIDFRVVSDIKIQIFKALEKDRALSILCLFFTVSILTSLFFALVVPTNSSDSMAYHLARIGFWIQNGTLAHFETNSLRQLVFPINSEILIMWPMVFLKKDYLASMAEYTALWGCIIVLFIYLRYLKISVRRILWVIFILASLPAVIIEASGTQTNLIVALFLLSSLYLFIYGIREDDSKSLIFSAIAFAVALGAKSTAILFIPVFGLIYLLITIKERSKCFYKPLLFYLAALIPAFFILSSYNYILNYIDYGNPVGPPYFISRHSHDFGIKSFLASFIKYFLLFINFTGIKLSHIVNPYIMEFKDLMFNLLNLKASDGLVYGDFKEVNVIVHENYAMFGILGFLLIIPLALWQSFKSFYLNSSKTFYIALSGLIIIGFLISISALMGFCYWYNRFFLSAIILGAPILIFSYTRKNNFLKTAIVFIAVLNYLVITNFNASKPIIWVYNALQKYDYATFRNEARLRVDGIMDKKTLFYDSINYLGSVAPDNSKIGLILSNDDTYYPYFEKNPGWKIYSIQYRLLAKNKNYNDYDFIVISGNGQYTDISDNGPLVYNYTLKGKDIIYSESNDIYTIYFNKDAVPVTSGKPFIAMDVIKFDEIPENFKLLKQFSDREITVYIYKKSKT